MKYQTQVLNILIGAKALILKGWCKNWSAVTCTGANVSPYDKRAVRWCLGGAIFVAGRLFVNADSGCDPVVQEARRILEKILHYSCSIERFNDEAKTKEEVVRALTEAISYVESYHG